MDHRRRPAELLEQVPQVYDLVDLGPEGLPRASSPSGSASRFHSSGAPSHRATPERAVSEAKRNGIARVHGFFVIGGPSETADEIRETFRYAARLQIDTFGFNRPAVYRGTPLWQEYVKRGIVDDVRDWDKTFKCCDIDPDTVPNDEVNRIRMQGTSGSWRTGW